MLLAIDVGNTHTVYGLRIDGEWRHVWRRATDSEATEDELAAWLDGLFRLAGIHERPSGVVCASVVPAMNAALVELSRKWFRAEVLFLDAPSSGLEIRYQPITAVGADRLANALGALDRYEPPIVVVDFGTATTFDAISRDRAYVGGAILPGVLVSAEALVRRTAKLPQIDLHAPERAIGTTTVDSLQSGLVLGYAGAIDTLAGRISSELGGATILATGGLSGMFMGVCRTLAHHEPNLTLDGLALAWERLHQA